jgi:hypothetical protein
VLAAFAAACVDIVDLKNIHYDINMLNDSHQKTASWVNPGIGAGRLAGRRLRLMTREAYGETYFSVIQNEVKNLNSLKMRDSSLHSK